jgi:hypothetical protein
MFKDNLVMWQLFDQSLMMKLLSNNSYIKPTEYFLSIIFHVITYVSILGLHWSEGLKLHNIL